MKHNNKRMRVTLIVAMMVFTISLLAQNSTELNYGAIKNAPNMQWKCPDVEKYQEILYSLHNDDYKVYANNIKEKFELYSDPKSPSDKYLLTATTLNIENPLFNTENLLDHISKWVKGKEGWKVLDVDKTEKKISASSTVKIASNASFLYVNKVFISPTLIIQLVNDNTLLLSFMVDRYKNDEYNDNNLSRTYIAKISEVYPFVPKSSYKICYAKAYVSTYQYFWNFISDLRKDLNSNFSRDTKMLTQLHYAYSNDSLRLKYGEPTKVIADKTSTPDINAEMRFYEDAQKIVFMGKTINFKDIISCKIDDDPQFIPGRTTSYGTGISFFGFGFGGAETYSTPNKTIHNYVVDVKIDNLGTPFMRIATGQNEYKAKEIYSVFDYILRHQQSRKKTSSNRPKRK